MRMKLVLIINKTCIPKYCLRRYVTLKPQLSQKNYIVNIANNYLTYDVNSNYVLVHVVIEKVLGF